MVTIWLSALRPHEVTFCGTTVKKYIDQLITWQILPFQLHRVIHECVGKRFASYCNKIRHNVAVPRYIRKFMPTEVFFLMF